MKIPVLFLDEHLIICEKPAGVSSESPGLPDLVSEQWGFNVWPVHRLDYGTGGTIILARSPGVCTLLQKQFQQDLIRKEYLAVVAGKPAESSGRYADLLFHDNKTNKTFIVHKKRAGVKEGICDWRLICSAPYKDQTVSLLRIVIHTGRTHQIRVQFGSRRFPLVGDRRYGSRIKADAPALWACSVCFPHPCIQNRMISVFSAPPLVFPWILFNIPLK